MSTDRELFIMKTQRLVEACELLPNTRNDAKLPGSVEGQQEHCVARAIVRVDPGQT